jgi:hypothetical protein
LTDAQPANFIDELTKFRFGLPFESKSENPPNACCSCRAREDPRINAVAGDNGELIGRVQFRAEEQLGMPPAFYMQLGQGLLQRRLDRDDLLGAVILFHRRLRACDRFLSCLNVDLFRLERHISQN